MTEASEQLAAAPRGFIRSGAAVVVEDFRRDLARDVGLDIFLLRMTDILPAAMIKKLRRSPDLGPALRRFWEEAIARSAATAEGD